VLEGLEVLEVRAILSCRYLPLIACRARPGPTPSSELLGLLRAIWLDLKTGIDLVIRRSFAGGDLTLGTLIFGIDSFSSVETVVLKRLPGEGTGAHTAKAESRATMLEKSIFNNERNASFLLLLYPRTTLSALP
jgi:hypothetical protein